MLKLAEKINLDKDLFLKDLLSKETSDFVSKELDEAEALEIDGTPTMIINGKKYVGAKAYPVLKEILVKHGAKEK